MKIIAGAFFVVVLGAGAWAATEWLSSIWGVTPKVITGSVEVIDGDTIDITGVRIRLEGIDAPETDQKCQDSSGRDYLCGIAASKALRELIGNDTVTCERVGKDGYGRVLGICRDASGLDVNAELVRRGLAVAFRRYSTRYSQAEDAARASKVGLWSGTFVHPGCFRAEKSGRPCRDEIPTS